MEMLDKGKEFQDGELWAEFDLLGVQLLLHALEVDEVKITYKEVTLLRRPKMKNDH